MAVEVEVADVVAILDPDGVDGMAQAIEDETLNIDPFIDTGIGLVNEVCLESDYSDDWLNKIALWLCCHFVCVSLPKTKQEAAKGLTETYEGQTKLGLDFTRYGQQAKSLDYKGNLAALDVSSSSVRKVKGAIHYIGGCKDLRKP